MFYQPFYYLRKSYVTLLELLVVIMILSIMAGVLGISVRYATQDQRFRTDVAIVLDKLRLAQTLMLTANADVSVKFATDDDGQTKVWLDFDEITKSERTFKKESILKEVSFVNFNDESGTNKKGQISLQFNSKGSAMSSGILRLTVADNDNDAGSLVRYICLSGYPNTIRAVESSEELKCKGRNSQADEDRRLTQYIMEEIPPYPQADSQPSGGSNGPQKRP